jgi:predicted house-cleaning noncanonical NTP pyrophosphatase (MazG superfamily)
VISSEELEEIVDDVLAEEEADFLDLLEALRPLFGVILCFNHLVEIWRCQKE